ncbi:hypothetical protein PM082_007026 [Marasmius tenuissimus]|nr:hypothetical protein PM082_007026 [Marasmius tenuissimus]
MRLFDSLCPHPTLLTRGPYPTTRSPTVKPSPAPAAETARILEYESTDTFDTTKRSSQEIDDVAAHFWGGVHRGHRGLELISQALGR